MIYFVKMTVFQNVCVGVCMYYFESMSVREERETWKRIKSSRLLLCMRGQHICPLNVWENVTGLTRCVSMCAPFEDVIQCVFPAGLAPSIFPLF